MFDSANSSISGPHDGSNSRKGRYWIRVLIQTMKAAGVAFTQPPDDRLAKASHSIKSALLAVKRYLATAWLFSGCINVLMLAGSLFMLQVYDRVLPSHSIPTLVALILFVVGLYGLTALLEAARARLFARIGRHVDVSLRDATFDLNIRAALPQAKPAQVGTPFKDLEQIRSFLASGGPSALFDMPWMPLYAVLLFLLHPYLGLIGLVGIVALAGLTFLADHATVPHQKSTFALTAQATTLSDAARQAAETIKPMGMVSHLRGLWLEKHQAAGEAVVDASDRAGFYSGMSRFLRMTLQSMTLALGAYLVIEGKATGGVMIASSILLGKTLAPVELAISHWRGFVSSRQSYKRLEEQLQTGSVTPSVRLPAPIRGLSVKDLKLAIPGEDRVVLTEINFDLQAGDVLGILGPSGAGKSTLIRALVGGWPVTGGSVRFDGSTLDQWTDEDIGKFVGYVPQSVELFSGSVAQNIGRFDPQLTSDAVLKAAQLTGVDALVRSLKDGYETDIGPRGSRLSAGQRQRMALARALYGDPFFVVLDEPNSALDPAGEAALIQAIAKVKSRGGIVIMSAHRPNVLQCVNKVLVLAKGGQQAFGLRDEVLKPAKNSLPIRAVEGAA
jgi:PrtD family type I secretion system ABC transporter